MTVAAWFSVTVGVLMLGQWPFFLFAGQVPELKTKPAEIGQLSPVRQRELDI